MARSDRQPNGYPRRISRDELARAVEVVANGALRVGPANEFAEQIFDVVDYQRRKTKGSTV